MGGSNSETLTLLPPPEASCCSPPALTLGALSKFPSRCRAQEAEDLGSSSFLILLTGELSPLVSPVYLQERPEEARLGMPVSLEEQILNSTFEACDPQRTGGGGTRGAGDQCGQDRVEAGNWGASERRLG